MNELPHDVMDLTREFLRSRFWLEVMKPELDATIEYADEQSIACRDPYTRFGWIDYRSALKTIQSVWLKEWLEPLPSDSMLPND